MRNVKRLKKLSDYPHAKIMEDPLYLRCEDEEKFLVANVRKWGMDAQRVAGYDLLKDAHHITTLTMLAMLNETNTSNTSTLTYVNALIQSIPSVLIRLRTSTGDNMLGKEKVAMASEIYLSIWEDAVKWSQTLSGTVTSQSVDKS